MVGLLIACFSQVHVFSKSISNFFPGQFTFTYFGSGASKSLPLGLSYGDIADMEIIAGSDWELF